jgi:hypothetical protein
MPHKIQTIRTDWWNLWETARSAGRHTSYIAWLRGRREIRAFSSCLAEPRSWMLFREILAVSSENSMKHVNTIWQNSDLFLIIKRGGKYTSYCGLNVINHIYARFEVFTAVTMKNVVFWDVTPYRYCVNRRFGVTYRLHLQGIKIRKRWTSVSRWLQPHGVTSQKMVFFIYMLSILLFPSLINAYLLTT